MIHTSIGRTKKNITLVSCKYLALSEFTYEVMPNTATPTYLSILFGYTTFIESII